MSRMPKSQSISGHPPRNRPSSSIKPTTAHIFRSWWSNPIIGAIKPISARTLILCGLWPGKATTWSAQGKTAVWRSGRKSSSRWLSDSIWALSTRFAWLTLRLSRLERRELSANGRMKACWQMRCRTMSEIYMMTPFGKSSSIKRINYWLHRVRINPIKSSTQWINWMKSEWSKSITILQPLSTGSRIQNSFQVTWEEKSCLFMMFKHAKPWWTTASKGKASTPKQTKFKQISSKNS